MADNLERIALRATAFCDAIHADISLEIPAEKVTPAMEANREEIMAWLTVCAKAVAERMRHVELDHFLAHGSSNIEMEAYGRGILDGDVCQDIPFKKADGLLKYAPVPLLKVKWRRLDQ